MQLAVKSSGIENPMKSIEGDSSKVGFRGPGGIAGGTWETFEKVMQQRGYFGGHVCKNESARASGAHMELERSMSSGCRAFSEAITGAVG